MLESMTDANFACMYCGYAGVFHQTRRVLVWDGRPASGQSKADTIVHGFLELSVVAPAVTVDSFESL